MRLTMWPTSVTVLVVVLAAFTGLREVNGAPFPAPRIEDCLRYRHPCCPAIDPNPPVDFQFQSLPMRTRRAAQNVDGDYIAKYRQAYAAMRALPAADPRSLEAQRKMHCAYCGGAFRYPNSSIPALEIHGGWFFFPWHRAFLYFHERILGSLIGDDTFTLPFWNWDNQVYPEGTPSTRRGNTMPYYFHDPNPGNSLYNLNRDSCALPPQLIDLQFTGAGRFENSDGAFCSSPTPASNNEIMRLQMSAETAKLFFGGSYKYSTEARNRGRVPGYLERTPHGNVHVFTGDANNNRKDMGKLDRAAFDPLFYAHHANLDRLWDVWIGQGGTHRDLNEADYLDSKFIFYDENKRLISIAVRQVLNLAHLKYNYEQVPNSWADAMSTMGTLTTFSRSSPQPRICAPLADREVGRLYRRSPLLAKSGTVFSTQPLRFRLRRVDPSGKRVEMLVVEGLDIDWTKPAQIHAFLFHPGASASSIDCQEFFGTFSHIPETDLHTRPRGYTQTWTLGLTRKLRLLHKTHLSHVVFTFVQVGSRQQIQFKSATIKVDKY